MLQILPSALFNNEVVVEIIVNGKKAECGEGKTVCELLSGLCVAPERTVVELRGEILSRELFAETVLCEGDKIEIIRFVGGG
ncbi:sulfur carrier protein ThiS [bacterium]|nr:MAG: sulfur carrier protein ThiS [bacterium]